MNCREPIVVAGLDIAAAFFRALDREVRIEALVSDGDSVPAGTVLMRLDGNARMMLAAERSALNTLQHLSGIATLTRAYVDAIAGTKATLLDTRKTVPGLRLLAKYAARMGGAENHRMRMDDGVLIKDNHVAVCGGVAEAVRAAKAAGLTLPVQVEVDSHRPDRAGARSRRRPAAARQYDARHAARGGAAGRRAGANAKPRAACGSIPSARSRRAGSIISRSGGSPSRRRRSTSASIMRW